MRDVVKGAAIFGWVLVAVAAIPLILAVSVLAWATDSWPIFAFALVIYAMVAPAYVARKLTELFAED